MFSSTYLIDNMRHHENIFTMYLITSFVAEQFLRNFSKKALKNAILYAKQNFDL